MTRDEIRASLIEVVDQALNMTRQGESVYAMLAKLLVERAMADATAVAVSKEFRP